MSSREKITPAPTARRYCTGLCSAYVWGVGFARGRGRTEANLNLIVGIMKSWRRGLSREKLIIRLFNYFSLDFDLSKENVTVYNQ